MDEVIVLSKEVQDYFKETYGRETHFIPNGVNRPQIREAKLITDHFGLEKDLKRAKNMMPQCKDKFSSIVPYYDDYSTVKWKPTTKNIVFFGALNRVENVKSALWFYENVFCKLKDTSWNLVLLGSHPDEKLVFLSQQDERVIVTGFVKDIRPWLQNCASRS